MLRIVAAIAAALLVGRACADCPANVADLVKQLGEPRYVRREAAQKELLKLGEGIVPELDRLAKTADAETAERLRRVRYELVGYKDDIRRLLAEVRESNWIDPVRVSAELRGLIAGHQPGSGELLLAIQADPSHTLCWQAMRTFVATWDLLTTDQIDAYIRQCLTLKTSARSNFPAKVGTLIQFGPRLQHGSQGLPAFQADAPFVFHSQTTCYWDGKLCRGQTDNAYPLGRGGWYRVGEVATGKHTFSAMIEYEFTHRGETRKGTIRSRALQIEAVAEDTAGDLRAPDSVATSNYVWAAFVFWEVRDHEPPSEIDPESVIRWQEQSGKWSNLRCPKWQVRSPLSVDLCYEVEIRDVKSGKLYAADPIVVRRGHRAEGYVVPRDFRAFAGNRDGLARVEVVLTPSRCLALGDDFVQKYFTEPRTVTNLKIAIQRDLAKDSTRAGR